MESFQPKNRHSEDQKFIILRTMIRFFQTTIEDISRLKSKLVSKTSGNQRGRRPGNPYRARKTTHRKRQDPKTSWEQPVIMHRNGRKLKFYFLYHKT